MQRIKEEQNSLACLIGVLFPPPHWCRVSYSAWSSRRTEETLCWRLECSCSSFLHQTQPTTSSTCRSSSHQLTSRHVKKWEHASPHFPIKLIFTRAERLTHLSQSSPRWGRPTPGLMLFRPGMLISILKWKRLMEIEQNFSIVLADGESYLSENDSLEAQILI